MRGYCAGLHVERLSPRGAKLRSLSGLVSGEALVICRIIAMPVCRTGSKQTLAQQRFDAAIVFSSVMAQYVPAELPSLVDFVDADSAKWSAYAENHHWPMSWIYRREGRMLLDFERQYCRACQTFPFSLRRPKSNYLRGLHAECNTQVEAMGNGVGLPTSLRRSMLVSHPMLHGELPIVFTRCHGLLAE